MRIIGLTKIRNESEIIKDTLDHWGSICTGGIYVYDDRSTDDSVEICRKHEKVKMVIEGEYWDPNRAHAEFINRQSVLNAARAKADKNDWFVYFDADERIDGINYSVFFRKNVKAVACKLYDFYITPEDENKNYNVRDFVGPEFRAIIFFFKNSKELVFNIPDQRNVTLPDQGEILITGNIKHYGKAISVEQWEKKCDYYIKHWPKYSEKWKTRKGQAVKKDYKSDFGNQLIHWHEIETKGFDLEKMPYGQN